MTMTAPDGLWTKWDAHQGAGPMAALVSKDRTAVFAAHRQICTLLFNPPALNLFLFDSDQVRFTY